MKNFEKLDELTVKSFSFKTLLIISIAVVIPVFAVAAIVYLVASEHGPFVLDFRGKKSSSGS